MQYPDEDNNKLYSQLRTANDGVPKKDKLIIFGDFNARVGADQMAYCFFRYAWPKIFTSQNPTFNSHSGIVRRGCIFGLSTGI